MPTVGSREGVSPVAVGTMHSAVVTFGTTKGSKGWAGSKTTDAPGATDALVAAPSAGLLLNHRVEPRYQDSPDQGKSLQMCIRLLYCGQRVPPFCP